MARDTLASEASALAPFLPFLLDFPSSPSLSFLSLNSEVIPAREFRRVSLPMLPSFRITIDAEDIVDDSDMLSVDAFNFELNKGLRDFFGRVDEAVSGESRSDPVASDLTGVSALVWGAFPLDSVSASSSWRALKDRARRKRLLRALREPPDVES